jgi:RNA-binding protein with serine-rich domain 1
MTLVANRLMHSTDDVQYTHHHSVISTHRRSGSPPPAKNGKDVKEADAKGEAPAAKPSTDTKAPAKTEEAQNGAAAKPAAKDGGRAADVSSTKLHVGKLTRNVTQEHMREIFATFGKLKSVELAMDRTVRTTRNAHITEFLDAWHPSTGWR